MGEDHDVGVLSIPWSAADGRAILESHASGSETPSPSASEPAEHSDTDGHAEGAEEHAAEQSTHTEPANETVLGVRIESPAAVTGAAIVSVALEGLIWRRPTRWVTAAVVLVAAGAAALDVAEISHQATENRGGLGCAGHGHRAHAPRGRRRSCHLVAASRGGSVAAAAGGELTALLFPPRDSLRFPL
jgi:hypothetical protein